MKLEVLRRCRIKDRKRGILVERRVGDVFDMDPTEEAEEIYLLGQSGRIAVVDEKFIPKSWRYIILYTFNYENEAGQLRTGIPRQEITLTQKVASKFLFSGHVRPVDEDGWVPARLLGPAVKEDKVKKMFDDLPEEKEKWVKGYRVKGGAE